MVNITEEVEKIILENKTKKEKLPVEKNFPAPLSNLGSQIAKAFDKKDLAEQIIELQPCYYDISHNWWLWDWKEVKWRLVDEVDILNAIEKQSMINTINAKERNEMLEALKQVSRQHKPESIKPTWIQFKEDIFDIETGEVFRATPLFFVTNPIPWELDKNKFRETPIMDAIFEEWVGKEYVKTLYEILAYSMVPDYPIHRLFCFVGGGMNGKSCFLRILKKFIGQENVCSSELDTLLTSRFEVTRLHKKLICMMGETNFNEMNKTSILKKLTGGDLIGFEYKGKNTFEDVNYAKIIISTNNLPATSDKTIGFYRRWLIIDFPNCFSEAKDIVCTIPDSEFPALARKCAEILKDLLESRKFTNEGTLEDRMAKYESKSNFLEQFIKEFVDKSNPNEFITVNEFNKKFIGWCKEQRHREMSETSIGKKLKELGFEHGIKYMTWMFDGKGGNARVWYGAKWK